jgi:hypothetical protein
MSDFFIVILVFLLGVCLFNTMDCERHTGPTYYEIDRD